MPKIDLGKKFSDAYAKARRDWLANHSRDVLHATVYRPDCYLREIKRENWDLTQSPVNMHGTEVT